VSYYEDRIKALEARIKEMSMLNRMKAIPVEAKLMDRIGELKAENARLKAEVERLTAFTTRTIIPNEELQAKVERLTKAGDAMEMTLQDDFNGCPLEPLTVCQAIHYWRIAKNAAKEGKGQP